MNEMPRPDPQFSESLRANPRPSFEIFPETAIGERTVKRYGGSGITVNVGSSPKTGLQETLALAGFLSVNGLVAVPHLAAHEVESEQHLQDLGGQIRDLVLKEVFIIKGDGTQKGPYSTSAQLIERMVDFGLPLGTIGIAGYPEGSGDMNGRQLMGGIDQRARFAEKAGAMLKIITQMCFSEEKILRYLQMLRRNGVDAKVVVGIPVAMKKRNLFNIAVDCRVGQSKKVLTEGDPDSNFDPQPLIRAVWNSGLADGIHLYTFNNIQRLQGIV